MAETRVTGDWLTDPRAQAVCGMLTEAGFAAHFVGGCVRNALMDVATTDVDIATNARPDIVSNLAKKAGFNPVPTGEEHGTITVVVQGHPFEITTWRRDVETDGRRAVVAFADTLEEDARRRDFTMNALYATPEGVVVDPLGGLADLKARRVRFIDDAHDRIREDYLRILRFFRFHAWYGDDAQGFDPQALAAIAELAEGLDGLSRERVGSELRKILSAPDPAPAVVSMAQTGVLARILPGADPKALAVLVHLEGMVEAPVDPIRRLASLGGTPTKEGLRLTNKEARALDVLESHKGSALSAQVLSYRLGRAAALNVILLNSALFETDLPRDLERDLTVGAAASFPVSAADLMPDFTGAALGAELSRLEQLWIDSGFSLSKEALLERDR